MTAIDIEIAWHKEHLDNNITVIFHKDYIRKSISRLELLKQKIAEEKVALLERLDGMLQQAVYTNIGKSNCQTYPAGVAACIDIVRQLESELTNPTQSDAN
jgi:hypothetical protein